MNKLPKILLLGLMLIGLGGLQACSDAGPMEEAGEDLDEAIDEAGDALEDACEDVTDSNC